MSNCILESSLLNVKKVVNNPNVLKLVENIICALGPACYFSGLLKMPIPMIFRWLNLLTVLALAVPAAHANRSMRTIRPDDEIEDQVIQALHNAPLHKEILTTVFWVGERAKPNSGWSSNLDSAWDMRWKENFGGLDSPVYRKGFFPAKFRPKQNPFYVALPFNDISNPEYLEDCDLLKFFKARKASRTSSVCKNRWIEITYNGKSCYAQWQDVGPIFTDDYAYVFRGNEPRAHVRDMAGLDVSPSVRDFLDLKHSARTSWRFVDESKVPQGPWKSVVTRS